MRRVIACCSAALLAMTALLAAHAAAAAQTPPETVLQQPRLSIGVADGEPEYLLFGARQALRTADGRIVVANIGTQEIRVYDAAGRHTRTLGRRGDGPGEFRGLQQLGLIEGDSIAAYDLGLGRITVFGADGRAARVATVRPFGNTVLPRGFGFTRQGALLVSTDFDRNFRPGAHRDSVHFALTNALGEPVDTLGSYLAEETFIIATAGFGARRTIAFGRDTYASARGDRLVIGSSDDYSFEIYFAGGRTRRPVVQPHTSRRVTREEVARADREYLATVHPRARDQVAPRISEFPHRDTYPAFGDLLAGADGTIWVQQFPEPGSAERRWTVFGADGRPQRTVRSGMPLRVVDAGADYVLAWTRDELEVERILLFDLPPVR